MYQTLHLTRGVDSATSSGVQPRLFASFFAAWTLACQAGSQQPSINHGSPPHAPAPPVTATSALSSADSAPDRTRSLRPDPPKVCEPCEPWNAPREPFRVFGNTYYVGTEGLSAILVVGNQGSVLIDGGLSQSALLIAENIRKLGFKLEDVRIILNSHAHYDHAGGIAALQRVSGATVLASPASKRALESGEPMNDDPQVGFGREANEFPALSDVQAIEDQQVVRLGDVALTAHFTPGHTPGGTSWTWRACEGQHCREIVYADSFTAYSAPGFRYSEGAGEGPQVTLFRNAIARIAKLPCDILLAPHPVFVDMDAKLAARQQAPEVDPFIDGGACAAYAARALEGLEKRLAEEKAALVTPDRNVR